MKLGERKELKKTNETIFNIELILSMKLLIGKEL